MVGDFRKKHDLNVIAVRRKGNLEINVNPHMKLETDMELIVIASVAKLNKLI